VIQPYRIKSVAPIKVSTTEERRRWIEEVGLNPFRLASEQVMIDLLTDSGTAAMSEDQWAELIRADEAYAGSKSWLLLEETARELFGFPYVLPAHQGRSAEFALFGAKLEPGQLVPSNIHFDTTAAHIAYRGARPLDLVVEDVYRLTEPLPFKGNMDLDKLASLLKEQGEKVGMVTMVLTCNSGGGQPASFANIKAVSELCRKHGVPFWIDAARIAENAYFIRRDEEGMQGYSVGEIVRMIMDQADGMWMSMKKDALANMGALICCRHREDFEAISQLVILIDGYVTYGGMSGRDMAAAAVGLREAQDHDYLAHRIGQVERMVERLSGAGVPVIRPAGGHAVYIDARGFMPHLPAEKFPGWALAIHGYIAGGVRSIEIGPVLKGRDPETGENRLDIPDLVRLAIPRRVYTQDQLDYVCEVFVELRERAVELCGVEFEWEAPRLRHFTSRFRWAGRAEAGA